MPPNLVSKADEHGFSNAKKRAGVERLKQTTNQHKRPCQPPQGHMGWQERKGHREILEILERGRRMNTDFETRGWGWRRLAVSARNLPVVFSAAFPVHCQPLPISTGMGIWSMTNFAARTE